MPVRIEYELTDKGEISKIYGRFKNGQKNGLKKLIFYK